MCVLPVVYSSSTVVMPQPMVPRGYLISLFTMRLSVYCMNVWSAVVVVLIVVYQVVFGRVHVFPPVLHLPSSGSGE